MTSRTVNVSPKVLRHMLEAAAHCAAGKRSDRPILASVHLESEGGRISVTATDMYVMAKGQADSTGGNLNVIVPLVSVRQALSALGPIVRRGGPVSPVSIESDPASAEMVLRHDGYSLVLPILVATYPRVYRVLTVRRDRVGSWLLDPTLLKSLALMARGNRGGAAMCYDTSNMLSASWETVVDGACVKWEWRGMGMSIPKVTGRRVS